MITHTLQIHLEKAYIDVIVANMRKNLGIIRETKENSLTSRLKPNIHVTKKNKT